MNAMNPQPNTGGRPSHYTSSQVTTAVQRLEDTGVSLEKIGVKMVKDFLVKEFGISKGVRESSLKDHVMAAILDRQEEQNALLLRKMPADVATDIEAAMGTLYDKVTLIVARQNMACQRAADQRCEELAEDKQALRGLNIDLRSEIEMRDDRIDVLEGERDSLLGELDTARAHLARLEKELDQKATQEAMMAELLAAFRLQKP